MLNARIHLDDHVQRTDHAQMQAVFGRDQKEHHRNMEQIGQQLGTQLRQYMAEFNAAMTEKQTKAVSVLLLEEVPAFQQMVQQVIRDALPLPQDSTQSENERFRRDIHSQQIRLAELIQALSGRFGLTTWHEAPSATAKPKELPPEEPAKSLDEGTA